MKYIKEFNWNFRSKKKYDYLFDEIKLGFDLDKISKEYAPGEKDEQYSPIFFRYRMKTGDIFDISNYGDVLLNNKHIENDISKDVVKSIYNFFQKHFKKKRDANQSVTISDSTSVDRNCLYRINQNR